MPIRIHLTKNPTELSLYILEKVMYSQISDYMEKFLNPNLYPTDTPSPIDVDSVTILCQDIEEKIFTNFHVIGHNFLI